MSDGFNGKITGRGNTGRFCTGNTFGKGRPKRSVENEYQTALYDQCSVETWKGIIQKAIEQATQGEAKARTFLANYILGKPEIRVEYIDNSLDQYTDEELDEILQDLSEKITSYQVQSSGQESPKELPETSSVQRERNL